jgi:tetratricopeptide (TPR) repeat protein
MISCASKKNSDLETRELDIEYKNSDFLQKKAKTYSKRADTNTFEDKEVLKKNLLAKESLHNNDIIDKVLVKSPLIELTKTCYEGDFEEAFGMIRKLQEEYRSHASFWNQVGVCFLLQKKYKKSLLFFNKSLEYISNYAPTLNNIGVMYEQKGEFQKALTAYKRATKSDSYAKTPKFNMALLYLSFGHKNKSISILEGLYQFNSVDPKLLNALGTNYLLLGSYKNALKVYNRLDEDLFENEYYGINYAYTHYLLNNKEKAQDLLEDIEVKKLKKYYRKVKNIVRK